MRILMNVRNVWLFLTLVGVISVQGCRNTSAPSGTANTSSTTDTNVTPVERVPSEDNTTPADNAAVDNTPLPKELVKPAAGQGNVQGKVHFNDKPAANIEVTLSEKFSSFLGASGKSYTARTDKNGDYVIKNVPPKEYEGLTARVFDTNSVIFIKSGIIEAKKYTVVPGKTLFVEPTHLFKNDLKLLSPKASATVASKQAVFKWQSYPGAAYYKISIYADDFKNSNGVFQERVESTTYQTEKPLPVGGYRLEVEAYNTNDRKLSESAERYKFRVAL